MSAYPKRTLMGRGNHTLAVAALARRVRRLPRQANSGNRGARAAWLGGHRNSHKTLAKRNAFDAAGQGVCSSHGGQHADHGRRVAANRVACSRIARQRFGSLAIGRRPGPRTSQLVLASPARIRSKKARGACQKRRQPPRASRSLRFCGKRGAFASHCPGGENPSAVSTGRSAGAGNARGMSGCVGNLFGGPRIKGCEPSREARHAKAGVPARRRFSRPR